MQVSDDIFLGPAFAPGPTVTGNPSPMDLGVGPMGRVYVWDTVPLTPSTTGLALAQLLGGAGNMTLTAGTGVTSTTLADGTVALVLDVPRCLTLTVATTNQSSVDFTIYGYDVYGQPMIETMAGPNANTVIGEKAFKTVYRVAASAAVATNGVSVGMSSTLGSPVRITDAGYIVHAGWDGALAADAGTFVAAVTTTATATSADVRGTFLPSTAADGARRLVMTIALPGLAVGPNATRTGAYGVQQYFA